MGNFAGYVRVSTQDQEARKEPMSHRPMPSQPSAHLMVSRCMSGFKSKRVPLNLDRPEFHRLLEGVRSGTVSAVAVAALDRFSRDPLETLQAIELIKNKGASFYCIRENLHIKEGKADLSSEIMLGVMSLFARNERETIKTRTMAGKKRKSAKGLWINGQAPCGYELNRKTKILQVNKEERAVVRRIWDEKLKGRGVNSILKRLTMDGIPLFRLCAVFPGIRVCDVIRRERESKYCRLRPAHSDYQRCLQCVEKNGATLENQKLWPKSTLTRILKNKGVLRSCTPSAGMGGRGA